VNPILVPAPPRSAYNQNRRVSDLLFSQLKLFQHIALKRGDLGIPPDIARDIYTEGGAARYIAAVTRAIRGTASSPPVDRAVVSTPKPANEPPTTVSGLPLAAVARTISAPAKKSSSRKAAPKHLTAKKPKRKK
jgi:hypothetical protein